MATDLERMVVSLEARMNQYNRELAKAIGTTNSTANRIEKRFNDMARKLQSSFKSAGTALSALGLGGLAGVGAGVAGGAIVRAADQYTEIANRLRGAGVASKDLASEQQKVVDIAIASRAELGATADLYTKLVGVTQTLGVSQSQAGVATQAVAQALSLSGVSAGAAAGAITQLGQALGSGVLRGDEFNSVIEALGNQNPIIKAIAAEFGVTTQELRGLAEQGELVADRVFTAIVKAGPEIERSFGNSIPTVESAFTNLETAAVSTLGRLNEGIGITNALASAMNGLAAALNAVSSAGPSLDQLSVGALQKRAADLDKQLSGGLTNVGRTVIQTGGNLSARERPVVQAQLDELRRRISVLGLPGDSESAASRRLGNSIPTPPTMDDDVSYGRLQGFGKKGGGGGRGRKAAGSARDKPGDAIKELELELQKTTAIGDARDAIILKERVLEAQRHAGVTAVSEEGKKIEGLVTAIDAANRAQEAFIARLDEIRDVADAGLGSFVDALLDGKSASEALNDSLKNIISTIAQIAEKSLLEGLFGASGSADGGLFSGVFKSLFGRASGGSVSGSRPYLVGERGPELFVPGKSGVVVPNSVMRQSAGGGRSVIVNGGNIIVQGSADEKTLRRVAGMIAQNNKQLAYQAQNDWRTA